MRGAGGLIYAIGGRGSTGAVVASVEVYDPRTNRWTKAADMPIPRFGLAAVAVGSTIYAIGGWESANAAGITARVDAFDTGAVDLAVNMHDKLTTTWGAMKQR